MIRWFCTLLKDNGIIKNITFAAYLFLFMKHCLAIIFVLSFLFSLAAQNAANPFELKPRLPETAQIQVTEEAEVNETNDSVNPFELQNRPDKAVAPDKNKSGNPFDLAIEAPKPEPLEVPSPREPLVDQQAAEQPEVINPLSNGSGSLLTLVLLVLTFASITLIFFRTLYVKAYRALFNDNLLSLLYREREAGALGNFLITYLVFFLSGALFLTLLSQHYQWIANKSLWQQFGLFLQALLAVFIGKHLLLAILGYIFPIQKETKRYSFTIMVFALVLGLVLTISALLLAYTPKDAHVFVIYGLLAVVVTTYILRSFRGLFIANRFIFSNQFHFLSYICAVEIGPALCLYKLVLNF
ncbi:MAG: DUF4271 domain-containing protein [Bacteroidota bacterium]